MVSVQTRAHVGTDGRINVQLPAEYRETNVDVTIIVEPVDSDKPDNAATEPMSAELVAEVEQWQALSRQTWEMFPYIESNDA